MGVHVSEHPLERPLAQLQPHTSGPIGEIQATDNGKTVKVAGMISTLRTLTTKKGDPMAFATLEDLDHKIDVVFFPRTWKEFRDLVSVDQVMLVTGKVQTKGDDVNIIVDRVQTKVENGVAADDEGHLLGNGRRPGNGNGNGNGRLHEPFLAYTPPAEPDYLDDGDQDAEDDFDGPPPPPNFDEDLSLIHI